MKKLILPFLVLTLFSACNDKGGSPGAPAAAAKGSENKLLVASTSCPEIKGLYKSADGKESAYVKVSPRAEGGYEFSTSENESSKADSVIIIDEKSHETEDKSVNYTAKCIEQDSVLITFTQVKDAKIVGSLKYTKLANSIKAVSTGGDEDTEDEMFLVY